MAEQENAAPEGSIVKPLRKSIPVLGEDVTRLVLREPTAADIIQIGNPLIFNLNSEIIDHHPAKTNAMLSRLSGVPEASLGKLDPLDWVELAWAIAPFFIPRVPTP